MITQELINRFFKNECTAPEKEMVVKYFTDHPEELNKYFNDEEWENFEFSERLHPAVSKKLFEKVEKETNKKTFFLKRLKQGVVAASIVIIVVAGWKFFAGGSGNTKNQLALNTKTTGEQYIFNQRFNTTAKTIIIMLPDSSTVELSPNSMIKYKEPFVINNKRDVYLTGKALFYVAKDKTKPFTVFSGDISTTALGTSFVINAFDNAETISVQLLTGKVVIKSADSIHKKLIEDKYLLPGQELIYNKKSMQAKVQGITEDKTIAKFKRDSSKGNIIETPNWYMFNNQSLQQVFTQLAELYNVKIDFSNEELKNMYFIGKFEKSDSLENILHDIALLNHLSVKKQHDGYIIRKKKK